MTHSDVLISGPTFVRTNNHPVKVYVLTATHVRFTGLVIAPNSSVDVEYDDSNTLRFNVIHGELKYDV